MLCIFCHKEKLTLLKIINSILGPMISQIILHRTKQSKSVSQFKVHLKKTREVSNTGWYAEVAEIEKGEFK
jgi:hypothetical protein